MVHHQVLRQVSVTKAQHLWTGYVFLWILLDCQPKKNITCLWQSWISQVSTSFRDCIWKSYNSCVIATPYNSSNATIGYLRVWAIKTYFDQTMATFQKTHDRPIINQRDLSGLFGSAYLQQCKTLSVVSKKPACGPLTYLMMPTFCLQPLWRIHPALKGSQNLAIKNWSNCHQHWNHPEHLLRCLSKSWTSIQPLLPKISTTLHLYSKKDSYSHCWPSCKLTNSSTIRRP